MNRTIIHIDIIPDEQGGGFCAYVPEVKYYLLGDGESEIESLESLINLLKYEKIELIEYIKQHRKSKEQP